MKPIWLENRSAWIYDHRMTAAAKFSQPQLPHPAFPRADWADCYALEVRKPNLSAIEAAHLAFGHFPLWVKLLLKIRNGIVALVGLQSTGDIQAKTTERMGFFPIVSQSDRQVVVGFDDRHLDFRVVIDVTDVGHGLSTVSATTLVYRKILLGRVYIAAITPFHRLIVRTMLGNVARRLSGVS